MYSNSDVLTDLGLRAASRKRPTLDTKVAAIAKALATRAARHTMGPRQRLRIHGVPASVDLADPSADAPSKPADAGTPPTSATTPPVLEMSQELNGPALGRDSPCACAPG
jgi:hypothetical protein